MAALVAAQRPPRERAVQLYREGTLSVEDIAREVGVSRATLYNWLQREGVSGQRRGSYGAGMAAAEGAVEVDRLNKTLGQVASDVAELCRMRELNTAQAESIRSDVNEIRRDVTELRATVARLVGIVEALASIKPRPNNNASPTP